MKTEEANKKVTKTKEFKFKEPKVKEPKPNGKRVKETINDAADSDENAAKKAGSAAANAANAGKTVVRKIQNVDFSKITEDVLRQAMKLRAVKIKRDKFLKKELIKYYPDDIVDKAIEMNPAHAGIERERINDIAKKVIKYETTKVSSISFAAGVPGCFAMGVAIPADITQYFGFIIRVMQKLAYLYGFEELEINEDEINDDTMNQILVFLGVMFGVQGANTGVKTIAEAAAKKISNTLAQKALTKGTVYPIVKKVANVVGIRMTKQIFADSVAKTVPVAGGVVSGGLTYATFMPCANKLQKSFMVLNLSDPDFYKEIPK